MQAFGIIKKSYDRTKIEYMFAFCPVLCYNIKHEQSIKIQDLSDN